MAIKDLIISILELSSVFDLYSGALTDDIKVDFDDGVFTDRNTEVDFYTKSSIHHFIPKKEVMVRLFKLTESEADEWIEQLQAEERMFNSEYQTMMTQVSMGGLDE